MSGIVGGAGSRSGVIGTTELDYEAGEWTPALTGGSGSVGSYNFQVGLYEKIGRTVTLRGNVSVNSLGDKTGVVDITGIPFASANVANSKSALHCGHASSLSIPAYMVPAGHLNVASVSIRMTQWSLVSGTNNLDSSHISAGGNFAFSIIYSTAHD